VIRVFLVEDQTLVREGLKSLLSLAPDVQVAGESATAAEALSAVPAAAPDVLLLDMRMPGGSGIDVLTGLTRAGALPPTLVLTTFDDDELLLSAIAAGARGWLLKDVTLERLTEAIRRVAAGETDLAPALSRRASRATAGKALPFESFDAPDPLTPRETEVLRLMAGGYSNREIADALGLSAGTVKNHISSILLKMGVRDRTRAVLKALGEGLIGG
jgi:DNA-binding NarL/FixJ family response regulator